MSNGSVFALFVNGEIVDVTIAANARDAALRMWTSAELPDGYSIEPMGVTSRNEPWQVLPPIPEAPADAMKHCAWISLANWARSYGTECANAERERCLRILDGALDLDRRSVNWTETERVLADVLSNLAEAIREGGE